MELLLNPVAGFLVGVLVGMTGVGGGALMTPLLVLVFGVAPNTAVGTDLLYASITKVFGVWAHRSRGSVDWVVVRRLACGSLPAAALTVSWLCLADKPYVRNGLIVYALGVALVLTSVAMVFKRRLNEFGKKVRSTAPERFKRAQVPMTALAGIMLGVLVTLTSVGAGALGTVMLVYLYPFRLTPKKLVGTDLAHAIPLALLAGSGHLALGNVDFSLLGMLLIGSIPGVWIGAELSGRVPEAVLRNTIAGVLALIGVRILA